jgi:hypothetical protein
MWDRVKGKAVHDFRSLYIQPLHGMRWVFGRIKVIILPVTKETHPRAKHQCCGFVPPISLVA